MGTRPAGKLTTAEPGLLDGFVAIADEVATDFWADRDGVASVLGDASGKTAEQVTAEFASNSLTGRFTRPDEVADRVMML